MMKPLTERQASILTYLKQHLFERGYPPTIREIAAHFRLSSPRGVKKHLDALKEKGYIRKIPKSPRAIELRMRPPQINEAEPVSLPILGRVMAGAPNLAAQEIIGHLAIDSSITPDPQAFILRVEGDSMVEDGILDGDYAVVKPQTNSANGDVVVAMVGEEATIKRFYRDAIHHRIRLEPANARLNPIVVTPASAEFKILGKVIGIVRKL
jgi:repressor LexA